MPRNILITGGSGYLGGSLLKHLSKLTDLPKHGTIYALVRKPDQAKQIKQLYGFEPIMLDLGDQEGVTATFLSKQISVVFFLIDAFYADNQLRLIEALAKVQESLGVSTHLVTTTGAKMFSSHAGHPTDRPLSDADERLFELQKTAKGTVPEMGVALKSSTTVIEAAGAAGVKCYTFVPCIVYGRGTGFGNPISIQTVAIVRAAAKLRKVYRVDQDKPVWPVCHVYDNTTLYAHLLRKILSEEDIPSGKSGYYLASSGHAVWDDIYAALADSLAKRGVIDDATVGDADDEVLERMAEALGCRKEFVPVSLGGKCTFTTHNARSIGWQARYPPEHILEAADDEVELVLQHL